MKKSFDEEIKNRLKDIEMPYDASAWKTMSDNLDKKRGKPSSNKYKWLIPVISLITISSLSIYLYTNNNLSTNENKIIKTSELKISKSEENTIQKSNIKSPNTNIPKTEPSINKTNKTENKINKAEKTDSLPSEMETKNEKSTKELIVTSVINENKSTLINNIEIKQENFIPLELPSNICLGETIKLKNVNSIPIYVIQPDGRQIEVKSKTKTFYTPPLSGEYKTSTIIDGNSKNISLFNVQSKEEIEIELEDDNLYKNGIPHRLLTTNSSSSDLKWFLNHEEIVNDSKSIELNLFFKGIYTIKLNSKIDNCTSSSSKNLIIEKDYNLLAVDAFSPLESNMKTNTFIPYALKERNVNFNFIIIDPKDGFIVYQTNDKLKPWDGIDQRTGQLVPKNSNWIWKVTIEKPLKGEKPNYKGIIVRI